MRFNCSIPPLLVILFIAPALLGESKKDQGRQLFHEKGCAYCHQIGGAGGVKGPALDGIGKRRSKEAIRLQIRNGGLIMPAYGDVLTVREIDAITEFLYGAAAVPAAAPVAAPVAAHLP